MICPTSVEHPLGALTADHNALLQQSLLHVHEETANNGISLEQVSHFKLHHHRRGPLLLTVIFQLIYSNNPQMDVTYAQTLAFSSENLQMFMFHALILKYLKCFHALINM